MKTIKKKKLSTYDEMCLDPKVKKDLDNGYKELILSELILALMQEDHVSVRMMPVPQWILAVRRSFFDTTTKKSQP